MRLADDMPTVCWVLVGDDGESDLELYPDLVSSHPNGVAGIALRQVEVGSASRGRCWVGEMPLVYGRDGQELLVRLQAHLPS